MKNLFTLLIFSSAFLTSCGSEDKKEEGTNICDCFKVGEVPNDCPELLEALTAEEFAEKKEACK